MKFLRDNIPNLLTIVNLICGLAGLVYLAEDGIQALPFLCVLVFIAGTADFLDGFVARLIGSESAIGKDLDSLADAVTFGVLPGIASFTALDQLQAGSLSWIALGIPVCSVIRLARFNNDPGQSDSFIGVPTPANAFFLLFLLDGIFFGDGIISGIPMDSISLSSIIAVSSLLLVSPFRIISLKIKKKGFRENPEKFILLLIGIILVAFLQKDAVPVLFLVYIFISFIFSYLRMENRMQQTDQKT